MKISTAFKTTLLIFFCSVAPYSYAANNKERIEFKDGSYAELLIPDYWCSSLNLPADSPARTPKDESIDSFTSFVYTKPCNEQIDPSNLDDIAFMLTSYDFPASTGCQNQRNIKEFDLGAPGGMTVACSIKNENSQTDLLSINFPLTENKAANVLLLPKSDEARTEKVIEILKTIKYFENKQ